MAVIQTIWTEETSVRSFETDFMERWKPACLFQAMQEAATHHASHFGYGYRTMLEQKMIWVLSRVKIKFIDLPVLSERVTIRTWPKGIRQKVFFMRDFQFESPEGKRLAEVTSAWILLDPLERRMVLPAKLAGRIPDNEGKSALDEPLEKIGIPENLPESFQVQTGYSAVDLMGHVNNARYIEWICDCFPQECFATRKLDWLQINYNREIRLGDRVSISAGKLDGNPDLWLVRGMNLTTAADAFDAAVHWMD